MERQISTATVLLNIAMKENKYDEDRFFEKYNEMDRSRRGLDGAGEWHELRKMLPPLAGRRVLDLGCGMGWHCRYAIERGADSVLGIDISEKMLREAKAKNGHENVQYLCMPIEDYDYPPEQFDLVISSLAFHYLRSFDDVCRKIYRCLSMGGDFVFSVEHPIFTASGPQDWCHDNEGNRNHWPVDRYFEEGCREAIFLGEKVTKDHKTLTTYLNTLLQSGFSIVSLIEPQPGPRLLEAHPEMRDELRRPMMLLVAARKIGRP